MPSPPDATSERIKDVNIRYHDLAAPSYDGKWGIDFGPVGQDQVRRKVLKALGQAPGARFDRALEIGAGTGYFSLNLLRTGVIAHATATDISGGMLGALEARAGELGLDDVQTQRCEAEELPFRDGSFDLVFGHAVLHHVPDLDRAFAEFLRVLRPGGTVAFCGEPSRYGDRIATVPKRAARLAAPLWRRMVGARTLANGHLEAHEHELESEVDVHAFAPAELRRRLRASGFADVRVRGEELLANAHGWTMRTVESTAEPESVPWGWRWFAFRSYIALQRLDTRLLEPRLPAELFYNLVLSARRPGP